MKKLLISILIASLVAPMAFAQDTIEVLVNSQTFSDVDSTDVEILYLAERGIVEGRPDLSVDSEGALNRAEALTVFARLFEMDSVYDPSCTFPDVEPDVWYAGYVSAMCNAGMVEGYPDGNFQATNQLNRAEAIKILVTGLGENPQPPYNNLTSDIDSNAWFAPYADYALGRNISRLTNGLFDAAHPYTRGDLFLNLYRIMRLQELEEDVYSISLDPQVIEVMEEGKSDDVVFRVTGNAQDAGAYFNDTNVDFDEFWELPLPLTYSEAANLFTHQFTSALEGRVSLEIQGDINEGLRKITTFANYDYTDIITNFLSEWGVSLVGKTIDDNISQIELDTARADLIDIATSYDQEVEGMGVFFNVLDPTRIQIKFDERGCGGSGIDYTDYDGYHYMQDYDYWPDLPPRNPVIGVYEVGTNRALDIKTHHDFDEESRYDRDSVTNQEVHHKILEGSAVLDVLLLEELDENTDYILKLNPLLLRRYVKNGWDYYGCDFNELEFLPASEFEFNGNSALQFSYGTTPNRQVGGIIGNNIISMYREWNMPLWAYAYDQSGALMNVEDDFVWSIVQGNGTMSLEDGITKYAPDASDDLVILQVEYQGFTDTIEIQITDSFSV
jgi:hypothetical protein